MGSEGKRRRLVEVDHISGFAILLVVIGHVVAREPPSGNLWYEHLKFGIYQFHMPLFMTMSGLVFRYTYTAVGSPAEFGDWARSKLLRLAPGFLLIGAAILVGKSLAASFIHVDNAGGGLVTNLIQLFVRPTQSAAATLWYIYVLLELYLLFPLLLAACRQRERLVLCVVVAMHATHLLVFPGLTRLAAIHLVFEYALYFQVGAMIAGHYDAVMSFVRARAPIFALLFAISFASETIAPWPYSKTIVGLASIPAALAIIGPLRGLPARVFSFLGAYSFAIYLMNTIAIGATKGIMLRLLPWDGVNFVLFFAVLTAVGLAAPVIAYRAILSRHPFTRRSFN
ncbi:MAG: acyltransferase [bacterium]|nr:acyltransferase [bacterium]